MKRHPALFVFAALSLVVTPAAFAHPGHDGHELTWDFGHLATHPLATLGCFMVISALAYGTWRYLRPTSEAKTAAIKAPRKDR